MITATIRCDIARDIYNTTQGYERTVALVEALHAAAPQAVPAAQQWRGGVTEPGEKSLSLTDREAFIQRLRKSDDGEPFDIVVVSAEGKSQPGRVDFMYMPAFGQLDVNIFKPEKAFSGMATIVVRSLLSAIASHEDLHFAFVDVYDNSPISTDPVVKATYRVDFATFPHRQCLGWMAYVPEVVTKEKLPLAADIIPAKGGSIIVAVNEPFDLANTDHIKRANQIEMDMNDLGLLAVTDPSF